MSHSTEVPAIAAAIAGAGSTSPCPTGDVHERLGVVRARRQRAARPSRAATRPARRGSPIDRRRIGAADDDPEDVDLEVDAAVRPRRETLDGPATPSTRRHLLVVVVIAEAQPVLARRSRPAAASPSANASSLPRGRSRARTRSSAATRARPTPPAARAERVEVAMVGPGVGARDRQAEVIERPTRRDGVATGHVDRLDAAEAGLGDGAQRAGSRPIPAPPKRAGSRNV